MSARARTALFLVGVLLLLGFALGPLFGAGLLATDYAALLDARGLASVSLPSVERVLRSPLARSSVALSAVASDFGRGSVLGLPGALFLRLENLTLLVAAALGAALATRRLLLPWTGSEHATGAARAVAVVLAVHPLAVASVADVRARGDLLGLVLGAFALAAFLRGRQDRLRGFTVASLVLCALGGFASAAGLGIPFLLAGAELCASHRYRPLRVRLRTAATTLVVFGVAASLDLALRLGRSGAGALPPFARALGRLFEEGELTRQLTWAVEKLGLLVLPSNAYVTQIVGLALGGVVFLLAMHPGLAAARSAPRLWGSVLFAWFVGLAGSLLLHADVEVSHARLGQVSALLPSVAFMAAGVGIGVSAVSGLQRSFYPVVVAIGYAVLAHGNVLPWRTAARYTARLAAELDEAGELHGRDARILAVDPPSNVRGVDPVGGAIRALVEPALFGREGAVPDVRGLTQEAFLSLVAEPEFALLRRDPLVLVFPERLLYPDAGPAGPEQAYQSLLLSAPRPSGRPLSWRASLRSPNLDVEALAIGALCVRVPADALSDPDQRVSWRAWERSVSDGVLAGVWVQEGAQSRAVFDLGASLPWRLGDRIKRIWFEGGLAALDEAELTPGLPSLGDELVPSPRGGDWLFPAASALPVAAYGRRGRFIVTLLDLATYELAELPVVAEPDGRLAVPGAARRVADMLRASGGTVAWSLDYRVDGHAVARARGRRVTHVAQAGGG